MDINGKEIIPIKYSQRIPLFIAKPEGIILENGDYKNDTLKNVQINGKGVILMCDARSGFYGCLDKKGIEVIPTVFEHLIFSENDNILFFGCGGYKGKYASNFFSGNIERAIWGCLDANGKVLIEARYDCFKIVDGYILGGRDGKMLGEGQHGNYESEYSGVYDLFDIDGNFLFGGFREFCLLEEHNIFLFKFGGEWEQDYEDEDDWGNSIYYYSYHFEKGNSRWLAVDSDYNSILLQKNGERKSFLKHIGTITKKKENGKVTNYWNMPLEVFSINQPYADQDCIICGDESAQFSVRISDGIQSSKYKHIEMINSNSFFFSEGTSGNEKVGIAVFSDDKSAEDKRIIDPDTDNIWLLTYPVRGFVFGVSYINDDNCKVTLYNIDDSAFNPQTAISKIEKHKLIRAIKDGFLRCYFNQSECNIQTLILPKSDIFDDEFITLICMEEIESKESFSQYWYPNSCLPNDSNNDSRNFNNYDYDDHDYMQDTWDAMTDGMYGDMPDGFDGDFDFLG